MHFTNKIFKLKGKVQHYAWGGYDFIPSLLSIKNEEHKPYAEYWMGAHAGASSEIILDDQTALLHDLIKHDPDKFIGHQVSRKFGGLPYLFKLLDVREMLSIQVHPTKEEAVKGFEAEERAGIALTAPGRNYKDANHKPEIMVALSEFWLLHGFKTKHQLQQLLVDIPEFNFLLPRFEEGYFELYKTVMELSQTSVDEILIPLIRRELEHQHKPPMHDAGYWIRKLFNHGQPLQNIDRGIFSIYFFNIVYLQPGEGMYQGAGLPHAYLFGQNVELMASSDNVLRGGLTPKHIDVPELLKHINFVETNADILQGNAFNEVELNYPCPAEDFGISAIKLQAGQAYSASANSAEIFLLLEGDIETNEEQQHFIKGDSFIILPGATYKLKALQNSLIYKAFVPLIPQRLDLLKAIKK